MTFREKLRSGKFVITAEVAPPRGVNWQGIVKGIEPLKGKVDAFNVTDCQRSMVRMSSVAMSKLLLDFGFDPVLQITCRDRNKIALQSDLLGAGALGIRNICLMTGDFTTLGDQKDAKPVFDIDSVSLIRLAKHLTGGYLLNGKRLDGAPDFCIGAVFNPFAGPARLQLAKLRRKVEAGAEFIQTQPVYSVSTAKDVHDAIVEAGAVPIVGLLPIKSLRMAKFIENLNPGSVPKELVRGIERARDPSRYGWDYVLDLAHAKAEFGRGIHFMLVGKTQELASFIDYLRNNSKFNHKF